jgi:hypothetical protein
VPELSKELSTQSRRLSINHGSDKIETTETIESAPVDEVEAPVSAEAAPEPVVAPTALEVAISSAQGQAAILGAYHTALQESGIRQEELVRALILEYAKGY